LYSYKPSLKVYLETLTSLVVPLIGDQCLPDWKLKLELFSKSQIASREHTGRSLKEILEYSNKRALCDLSPPSTKASTSHSVDLEKQVDVWRALSSPSILDPNNPSITSYADYLPDYKERDQFDKDFVYN
jgi:hypothetical protein